MKKLIVGTLLVLTLLTTPAQAWWSLEIWDDRGGSSTMMFQTFAEFQEVMTVIEMDLDDLAFEIRSECDTDMDCEATYPYLSE